MISHLRLREYGLTHRQQILASVFHTGTISTISSFPCRYSSAINLRSLPRYSSDIVRCKIQSSSRKRTVSENDENRRDSYGDEKTSKRLCRSSEWIFGDSQLTLFKSISTIDNRPSIVDNSSHPYLLSKSEQYLSTHHRRYSSEKQQTIDTLSNLVLSQ